MDTIIIDKIPILNKKKSEDTYLITPKSDFNNFEKFAESLVRGYTCISPESDFTLFEKAVAAIQQGSLVAFPTETVYGLGANALDDKAVLKIFEAKGRPSDNPLIVHVAEKQQIYPLVRNVTKIAKILIDSLMPGPITLVFEKSDLIPGVVSAGLDTVAIRIPSHPVAHLFLEMANIPVAAPSANVSGKPSTTTAEHVYADLKGKIPYIIDGGACNYGIESTVVDVTGDVPVILRPGTITAEQIYKLCGSVSGIGSGMFQNNSYESALNQNTPGTPMSPGMKYRHYAPKAKVVLADAQDLEGRIDLTKKMVLESISKGKKAGVYGCNEIISAIQELDQTTQNLFIKNYIHTISYGAYGDMKGASAKLFAALREMDENLVETVIAEALPIKGVGVAYMNRLLKAAGISSNKEINTDSDPQSNNLKENKYNENFDADLYLASIQHFDSKIKHILFVCTGNTCRSPIAQGYFNYKCEKLNAKCSADSAGISAMDGEFASYGAIDAMNELYGIDLSGHRAKMVTHDLIANADIILTMTDSQRTILLNRFKDETDKIFTIAHFANNLPMNKINGNTLSNGIADPYGQDVFAYRQTAMQLAGLIDMIFANLYNDKRFPNL